MRMTTLLILGCMLAWPVYAAVDVDTGTADAQLNANYNALRSQLDSPARLRLRDAQRAWMVFRDKECDFRALQVQSGARTESTRAACITELTQERSQALEHPVRCADGVDCGHADIAQAVASDEQACAKTLGKAKAAQLVQQCIEVSPATHPPCNAANSCEMIRDEIKRGCALIGKDAPKFCAAYQ